MKEEQMHTEAARSEDELVERLYEAADAVEDEDVRDELYQTITTALEVWALKSLERVQSGELAPV
jgi:hypothetical protein